jgi:hypothetical protein
MEDVRATVMGMTRVVSAAGFPLRSNEPKCANTMGKGGGLTCVIHCAEARPFHVIWECFGKFTMSTESDLAAMRLAETLSPGGSCSGDVMPIKLLRVGGEGFGG